LCFLSFSFPSLFPSKGKREGTGSYGTPLPPSGCEARGNEGKEEEERKKESKGSKKI